MSRPRVLILGATGMLGHKLCDVLGSSPAFEVHATVRRGPEREPPGVQLHAGIDLTAGTAPLRTLIESLAPDVIVNAIGAIKQKDLRAALDETFFVNAALPHELAQLNPNGGGRVIHISTDCVFAGDRGRYRESDRPDVLDVYGRSKAVGEIDYGAHLTLRTSIIGFERHGHLGLLSWFFSQPRGTTVRGFTRAIFSGLPTTTLAAAIRDVLLMPHQPAGLYHVASEGISKYDLLTRVNDEFDLGIRIEPDDGFTIDRSLDDGRFRTATGTVTPGWGTLLAELHQDYLDHHYDAVYEPRRQAGAVR